MLQTNLIQYHRDVPQNVLIELEKHRKRQLNLKISFLCFVFSFLKVRWELNPTAMVMETTVLEPVAAFVSLAGRDQTALNPSVPITARTGDAALTESVSASRASLEKTAHSMSVLRTAEPTASVWAVVASAQMASSAKTALRPSASTTAKVAAAARTETACAMNPGPASTALNSSAPKTATTVDAA